MDHATKMPEIREINDDEYDFLTDMLREAVFYPDPLKMPEKMIELEPVFTNYFDNFGRAGDFAFVLVIDARLSGAVWTRLYTEESHYYGFVDEKTPELGIAVKKEWRDRGFGRLMIEKLIEKLSNEGFAQVSLSVDKRNRAVKLYERMDFRIFSESENSCTMVKSTEKQ
ncbi:MAG: GNAT family N-acetyltransferase [Blastocatellia bacterium]